MRIWWGTSRSVVREGEITKEGDYSAEGHCSPDRDRLVAGFRRVVARTGHSNRASCGNSSARTGLTDLGHLRPSPNAFGWRPSLKFLSAQKVQRAENSARLTVY